MREIEANTVIEKVKDLCIDANCEVPECLLSALRVAREREDSPSGKAVLGIILRNAEIAREERVPICQDTGIAVVFVEMGEDVRVKGGNLKKVINEGVRRGYKEGYLRNSMCDPFTRENTGDNTPAVIHFDLVPGDKLKLIVVPKGGGAENMSGVTRLRPSDGVEGFKDFVVTRVRESSGNACPPIIVGVGIGGTFEQTALLAKKALLRPVGKPSTHPELAKIEKELLKDINDLGIGPMGLGGRTTALAVHIETFPCHIASLLVAININCHAHRHKEAIL